MDFKFSVKMWLNSKVGEARKWGLWIVLESGKFGTRGDAGLWISTADLGGVGLPESFRFWEKISTKFVKA